MLVTYRNMTQAQRDRLKPFVDRVVSLNPWWAQALRIVNYADLPNDAAMSCRTEYSYQSMQINIGRGIMDSWTNDELFNDLMHEVAHGYNDTVRNVVDEVLGHYVEGKDLEVLKDTFVRAIEFDTETLATLFRNPGLKVPDREFTVEDN